MIFSAHSEDFKIVVGINNFLGGTKYFKKCIYLTGVTGVTGVTCVSCMTCMYVMYVCKYVCML